MNSKLIVVGAISAAVGAVVSWAFTADYYDNKLKEAAIDLEETEKILRKTEDSIREKNLQPIPVTFSQHFDLEKLYSPTKTSSEKIEELRQKFAGEEIILPDDEADNSTAEIIAPIEEVADEAEGVIPPGETPEETRSKLQDLIHQYTGQEPSADEFVDVASRVTRLQKNEQPVVISQEEFAWSEDYDHFDKQTLTYYPAHRLLIDEDEEVVAEIPYVIGWRNLSDGAFGGESGDPDTVFVRNYKMETDFEINRETEEAPPLHTQMGMGKHEYEINKAAGLIKPPRFRPEE